MKLTAIMIAAVCAAGLAGCSTPPGGGAPVVSPQVTTIEQDAFATVCPVIAAVGPFVPLAGPPGAGAYVIAQGICAAGTITSEGSFLAEFVTLEPAIVAYFNSIGLKAKAAHVRALHRDALRYHLG